MDKNNSIVDWDLHLKLNVKETKLTNKMISLSDFKEGCDKKECDCTETCNEKKDDK